MHQPVTIHPNEDYHKATLPQGVAIFHSKDNLIKSNLLHLDGVDLHNCCLLEIHPEPFTIRVGVGATTMKALTHTDNRTDQYSRYLREIIFRLYLRAPNNSGPKIKVGMTDTLWFQVKDLFNFQMENLYNQFEDVTHVLLTMCLRELDTSSISIYRGTTLPAVLGYDTVFSVLEEYHAKLFDNYMKWCDYMRIEPFPWGSEKSDLPWKCEGDDPDAVQMVMEIILFKLIWGESSNLRHTPELLCFLFHWSIHAWKSNRVGRPIDGEFIDVVAVFVQRICDEAWHGSTKLKPHDHSNRLYYDDVNELFWESACLTWLQNYVNDGEARLSTTSSQLLIDSLAKSRTPGKSVKTFVERRSYAQVFRAFIRVFHWHYFIFQLLFWARSCWDGSSIDMRNYEFGEAIFSAIILSVIQPCLELSLYDVRSLRKGLTWLSLLKLNILNLVRLALFSASILVLIVDSDEGFRSRHFQYDGFVGFSFLVFYAVHGIWPFLHIRVFGLMPLFVTIWNIPVVRWLLGPSTFTGGTALLAEDFLHVVAYIFFWTIPLVAKTVFWFFGVIPKAIRSANFLNMVELHPLYFYDFAVVRDKNNRFLKFLFWAPILTLWFFDTQIFFLLFGSLYATFLGYLRRVGYVQDIATIQKRLLPLLTAYPLLSRGIGAMATPPEGERELSKNYQQSQSKFDQSSMSQKMKRSSSYGSAGPSIRINLYLQPALISRSAGFKTPRQSLTGSTPISGRNPRGIEYTNNRDPYARMTQNLNAAALAKSHHLTIVGPIDEASRDRKCFGFVWNEICHTWRLEDVISNEELFKLQFNEFPAFLPELSAPSTLSFSCTSMGLNRWSEFRSRGLTPVWDRSTVRLPVYVYADLILSFLEACENYQLQSDEDALRLRSRGSLADRFFKKYLSSNPVDQLTTNMRSCLPMEGMREVVQAFFMYVSRYFSAGSLLVEAVEQLWEWICEKPSRLEMFDLLMLRELRIHLIQLLTTAQQTRDLMASESACKDTDARHQEALLRLVACRVLESQDCPPEIQHYITAVDICFSSAFTLPPACEPPNLESAEISSLMVKLQQVNLIDVAPATTPLGLYNCDEIFQPYLCPTSTTSSGSLSTKEKIRPLPTLKREVVIELRTLLRIDSGACLPRDVDGVLKLYFRRAVRILSVSEVRLGTSEGQRRLKFFTNSLLMKMPVPPEVTQMVSMCTLTPFYREECLSDLDDLHQTTQEGVAKMELLRSLMPQEFSNFLERVDGDREMFRLHQDFESLVQDGSVQRHVAFRDLSTRLERTEQLFQYVQFCRQLQRWASDRSQVLSRTVRGIMYYETALQILLSHDVQNFIECRSYEQLHLCHDLNRLSFDQQRRLQTPETGLWRDVLQLPPPYLFIPSIKALARVKFSYVVAAQEFGGDCRTPLPRSGIIPSPAQRASLMRKNSIIEMLRKYPSLRVATLEEELDSKGKPTGRKFSVLYRWSPRLYFASPKTHSSTERTRSGKPDSFPVHDHVEDDCQTIASETEEGKEKAWFQVEPSQKMSPPRHSAAAAAAIDSPWSNLSLTPNVLCPSSDQSVTPIRIFTTESQSPLRLRYSSAPSSSVGSGVYSRDSISPGGLEDCRSPEVEADDKIVTSTRRSKVPRSSRLKFGKLTCPTPPRFSPILASPGVDTSELSPSCVTPDPRYSKEPVSLNDTPLVGRDNDLISDANITAEKRPDEIHGAALYVNSGSASGSRGRRGLRMVLDGELVAIFKILLPTIKNEKGNNFARNPFIGPGKPENQNHAMIFTRGETIQAIDMNMEGYLEEAVKLRNLLQEFTAHPRMRILGFREHIFSLDVSSISSYMALQELAFVTNNQRLYHDPLCTRMHYGHPDIFDRFFIHCCGGMSKASNGINLSEDVFAGYNATQRGFTIHHIDYLQVGKGRDVGLQQIFMFEKKVAGGNAEQMLSRDIRRMCDGMDFYRMMSFFYSGPGFFLNSLILMFGVFMILYGKVFLSFARQTSMSSIGNYWDDAIAPVTNIQLQLGMLLILPIVLLTSLERGLSKALGLLLTMVTKFALLYYNFMVGTKAAVVDGVLVYGGARYQETGRGFQIAHGSLETMWRFYYFTHFQIAVEILLLLCLYAAYGGLTFAVYVLDTWPLWILFISFTWTPFIFNPLGAFYPRVLDDLSGFNRWMNAQDLQSGQASWRAWWRSEMDNRAEIWWHNRALVFTRLLRFIGLSFGLVTVVAQHYNHSVIDTFVYLITGFLTIGVVILFMTEFKLINPSLNKLLGFLVVVVVAGGSLAAIFTRLLPLSILLASLVSFSVLVYGLTRLALVATGRAGVRHPLLELSMRVFHVCFAYIVFFPIIIFASITTSFHLIQTRVLFNQRFVGVVDSGLIKKAEAEKKGQ